ncbi:MAG TPA: SGNH/GDSL hydrolase family protein [Planctomycetota bacterium]|nr:SGNH/GDSL hydrolase family protein [Planctomycetota bacterium]
MRLRRVLLALAVTAGTLLAAEAIATCSESPPKYRLSDRTGYELVPGWHNQRSARPESIDADGLRGAEVGPRRPGCLRILCAGGSTTFGHMLRDDETWPVALQQRLTAAGLDVEVLNGGVPGWGLEQVVRSLVDDRLRRLQPDLVIFFEGWNSPTLQDNRQNERFRHDLLAPQQAGLPGRSALVRQVLEWFDSEGEPPAGGWRPLAAQAAEAFPRLLPELAAACAAHGARLAVVRFPALAQRPLPAGGDALAAWDHMLREHAAAGADLGQLAQNAREQHAALLAAVEAGASAAGAPLLDVAGAMEASLPADRAQADAAWAGDFMDRMHLTAAGCAAFAAALARLLAESDLLAPAGSPSR